MTGKSNVILKTLNVLKAFTDEKTEWGVNELSRHLETPVSSLHRILKTLRDEAILQVNPQTGKYTFGMEMIRIASIVHSKSDIKIIVEPYLKKLSETVDESVYMALYYPQHKKLSFIHNIQSSRALQYVLELGVLQPIHIAASGKAILSFLSDEEIKDVFFLEQVSDEVQKTIWRDIEEIRKNGYSITSSERKKESIGIGAPLFDATGKVIGSIICAIPAQLYNKNQKNFIIENILQTSRAISHQLGYQNY